MSITAQYLPSLVTIDGATWLNPDNVKLDDGSVAVATLSRSINYPVGYSSSPTGYLSAQAFTGLTGDMAVNDTIDGFEVEIKAMCSNPALGVALSAQVTQYGSTASQLLTDTMAVYTFGHFDDTFGLPLYQRNGLAVASANVLVSAAATIGTGDSTVSIDYIKIRLYWSNTACTVFSFTPQSGVALGTWIYSNVITIAGLPGGFVAPTSFGGATHANGPFSEPVSDAEICKNNDGKWMTSYSAYADGSGSVNGDTYQIRRRMWYSRPTDEFSSYNLYVHGFTRAFTMTTVAADISPTIVYAPRPSTGLPRSTMIKAPFTFHVDGVNTISRGTAGESSGNVAVAQWLSSDTTTDMRVTDIASPHSADGNQVRQGVNVFTDIFPGADVEFWAMTPAAFNTTFNVANAIFGDQFPTWALTSEAATLTPTEVFFTTPAPVVISTVTTSNTVTMAGINSTATVTFASIGGSAHEFQKNGGAWTAIAGGTTVVNGDTIAVRHTSSGSGATASQTQMIVNGATGMNATFTIITAAGDITPTAPAFTNVTSVAGLLNTSNTQVIGGMTAAMTIKATVSPGFQIKNGAGAFTDGAVSVANGDTISVRGYAPLQAGKTATCNITIGGTTTTWTITSRAVSAFWD